MNPLILIADDDKNIRNVIKLFLQNDKYAFIEAQSGQETIEIAKRYKPHVILLDIVMPDGDGFEVCKTLKNDEETKSARIIMLTVKQDEQAISDSIKLGADDYIAKPFTKEIVRAKVEQALLSEFIDEIVGERRRATRKVFPLNVTWGFKEGTIFNVEFKTKMVDISIAGFSFEHSHSTTGRYDEKNPPPECPFSKPDPKPNILNFLIEFPDNKVLEVRGAVRHVRPMAAKPKTEKVGVEFVDLPVEAKSVIEKFVNQ